jgi:two-component system phosphate regulon sensor histidine kinase PhoR
MNATMPPDPRHRDDAGPTPRAAPAPWAIARLGAFAGASFVAAWLLGAPVVPALAAAAFVAAVLRLDRAATRAETAARQHVAVRAARVEGTRDAAAHTLSLELAYERSRSVLEALREGVVVVDGSGEIVLANPAARRATRAPASDLAGRLLWDALLPELAERARDAWRALRESPRSATELPQIRYTGIPCRDSVYDLTAVQATSPRTGQDFGTVFLLVDTTRSFELQRLKDRFLSSVSHELRTPLTNICAYAELLHQLHPGTADEWTEFARVIHAAAQQLSTLVDGMFDYLQLESGEARFASEPVDGVGVVRQVTAGFAAAALARRHELAVEIAPDAPRVLGDRVRVEQVVRNLVDNAIKFTPDGGTVRVAVRGRDEGWELRVEDSGPGVPPSDREAVFEKFNQLRDHLTEKPPGTGLGLATSRAIVAVLGGLIWCEASPLGGATFVVLLPGVGQPRLAAVGAGTGAGGGF